MSSNCSTSNIPGLLLYDALVNNSLKELKRCVDLYKIDLNARLSHVRERNHTDLCPVHLVTYKGHISMLHYLIQNNVNVHQPTSTLQRRAVHFAALRHQVSCMKMLLNAGAQVDVRDTFGNTPLHYAAEDGDVSLLCLLLNNGANVDTQDITSKTSLMKAARSGKLWAVRRLINFGANLNMRDRNDETALHYACRQGSTEVTGMLIKAGARLNAQNQIGLTPLMEAVSYNQREAVGLLVKQRDVDLYKRDFCAGDTALHIAVKKNYIHMVEILLQAGNWYIEYNYNNLGESFVHDVVAYNRLELLRLFLAYNYDFDQPAKRLPATVIPSRPASSEPIRPSARTHLSHDLSTIYQKSPFHLALERGHLDMARILSDVGCFRIKLPVTSCPIPSTTLSGSSPLSWYSVINPAASNSLLRRYSDIFEVKSLKKWCRKYIRNALGFRLIDGIAQLPLPIALKDYLLLRDIDWSVCWSGSMSNRSPVTTSDLAIIVPPHYTNSNFQC